ncbi:MAG: acetoin utilization protein AcuC [Actinomycetes bacterium]
MASATRVVWDPSFSRYDFGPSHPMSPVRLELTARLADSLGLFDLRGVRVAGADVAPDDLLTTVHEPDYVAAVRAVSADPSLVVLERGLGTDDDPAFAGMHDASARVVTGSVECADEVWRGDVVHAVNFCGGLHHAMPDRASGFCVYNDTAVAIRRLLAAGARKVAYVDVDVHHGDGTQAVFWDDPRVLTVSLHETGRMLFPGTGFPEETGGPEAEGSAVNVALPPGTGDAGWLRAVHAVVHPLVRAFAPDVLVTQHGCDTHFLDPLAHLAVSLDAQRAATESLHALSHEVCDGRWVATGGGGYEVVDVVPRAWAHLVAIAAHAPVAPTTRVPIDWLEHVRQRFGRQGPGRMTDGRDPWWRGWEVGYDPEDAVDRAVMATRKAVFPLHGLDPWFD